MRAPFFNLPDSYDNVNMSVHSVLSSIGGVRMTPDPNTSAKYCDTNGRRIMMKILGAQYLLSLSTNDYVSNSQGNSSCDCNRNLARNYLID